MDLIDKKNHLILKLGCLVDKHLDTMLKFTTILGSCNHSREIDSDNTLVLHGKRDFPEGDTTSESLYNSRLPDSRISNETWIILGLAVEDRDKSVDLRISSDDGIDLLISGFESEISAEEVECWSL
jgi:hypothetical protein